MEDKTDSKSIETKKRIAKEIILNFKLLGICCLLSILFYIGYYSANNPENLSRQENSEKLTDIEVIANTQDIKDTTELNTSSLKGINHPEPDFGLSTNAADYVARQKAFRQASAPMQDVGFAGVGDSKYDEQITSLTELNNLHETRMEFFKEDVKNKTINCFFICISILILGRYILIGISSASNWLEKYSK
ncbi:hypothetical protein [uncultured Dysgonomonas sp.]|uniref:Uncharacterized protein n=1 Tax=uncultured Dysgonomonas sp. TaxID=206096 RepID=A0A212J452_9BACT|nr:hypothetical protein [uncultured Dysgonomonas sp.]SBV94228.1 hypothetical protein KL86DYS1_11078 [uncultured Dysgonomonas sp.]